MNRFEPVQFPTSEEKSQSIRTILDRGVAQPQRLRSALPQLWRALGVRGLFFGVWDCVLLATLASALVWCGLIPWLGNSRSSLYVLLFVSSPFLYGLLHTLTIWKEISTGTYELLMTCRYSLQQITVMRMLVFGGASLMLSVAAGGLISLLYPDLISMLEMVSICCSALFLFATVQIIAEQKWPMRYFIAPAIWILLGLGLILLGEKAESFLIGIPIFVFWIITLVCAGVYGMTLRHIFFNPREGAISYAFN